MTQNFTTKDRIDAVGETFTLLKRFVVSLPLLRKIFFPNIFVTFLAATLPQIFLWLTAVYSECIGAACYAVVPFLGWRANVTIAMLFICFLLATLIRIFSWALFEISGQWSAQSLHQELVRGMSNVRTTYFDEYPSGRIINRLIRDFENFRVQGVIRLGDTVQCSLEVLTLGGSVVVANPIGGMLIVPTVAAFMYIQSQIAPMLQKCSTMQSARFGEVLHRETDLIEGARTFLLYGEEEALLTRLRNSVEHYIQTNLVRSGIEAWGRFWTSSITSLYTFLALLCVSYAVKTGRITEILGAVVVTAIFRLAPVFHWLTWTTSFLIESLSAARRIFEIVDLPHERNDEGFGSRAVLPNLPLNTSGEIVFDRFTMSYRKDTPPILKDLTLVLPAGKQIGIIGRTGAGKSSLIQSLYRMVYVHSGTIRVGGDSLFEHEPRSTRELFSIVPQDPYLFAGTVRSNLNRGNTFGPVELSSALERVHFPFPIDHPIEEGGKNLSYGERQLLCLGRVILEKRPYVLMDEPTSGVDTVTDAIMQEVLRTSLSDRTVITIAHRLETLRNYDVIVELEEGRLLRQGTPEEFGVR